MQARAIIMLAIAVIFGIAAVVLVNALLTKKVTERPEVRATGTSPLVVAAVDLKVGTRLEEAMLKRVAWPEEARPKDGFSDTKVVIGPKPAEAPVVLQEVHAGEPVLKYKLSKFGARGGLTVRLKPGQRAMTIAVNEVRGVAGFVLPGDHVDILHTSTEYRTGNKPATRLLLQNVKVLAIDQASSEDKNDPVVVNAVTLLVTTQQGEKITLAQRIGTLSLLLRNEADQSQSRDRLITVSDLGGAEVATATPKPVVTKRTVRHRTYSGARVRVIKGLSVTSRTVKKEAAPVGASGTSK
jgi:pilus assembly protein CpaB